MIKCSLLDITTDNRAVVIINEGTPQSEVKTTPRLDWINYEIENFRAGKHRYDFMESAQ